MTWIVSEFTNRYIFMITVVTVTRRARETIDNSSIRME